MRVFKMQVKIGQLPAGLTFSLTIFPMALKEKLSLIWEFSDLRITEKTQTTLLRFQNLVISLKKAPQKPETNPSFINISMKTFYRLKLKTVTKHNNLMVLSG